MHAKEKESLVNSFFRGDLTSEYQDKVIESSAIDYIYVGPREKAIGYLHGLDRFNIVYEADEVTIYRTRQKQ